MPCCFLYYSACDEKGVVLDGSWRLHPSVSLDYFSSLTVFTRMHRKQAPAGFCVYLLRPPMMCFSFRLINPFKAFFVKSRNFLKRRPAHLVFARGNGILILARRLLLL